METISLYFHKVIIGQILADGHVERTGKNCRLSFSFGTAYLLYGNWIYSLLQEYCSNPIYSVVSVTQNKQYTNYRLKTRTTVLFNSYRDMFYVLDNGKHRKIVPTTIKELLCPIVLAHLIIGDGTFSTKDSRIRIYTNHFSFEECVLLANAITVNCDIQCKVIFDRIGSAGDKQYILTIGKNQLIKLQECVSPYMHTSILYRIGLLCIIVYIYPLLLFY